MRTADGCFDSKRELARWAVLKVLQRAGQISQLLRQQRFPLHAEGREKVGVYVADFTYYEGNQLVVEDCKGFRTPLYLWKKRHLKAEYGIQIKET